MKLAGYIRVSTEGQVDAFGKDVQRDAIVRWASLNGHLITHFYEEDGVSGKVDGGERPALAQLIEQREAKRFEGLVVFDATRLARRLVVQETLLALVRSAGLKVFTTTAGEISDDDDDPTRVLIRQILGVIAEFDHRNTVKRLTAGRVVKSAQGGYIGGIPPYGSRVVGTGKVAQLMTDPVESAIVQAIMDRHAQGMSFRAIATQLNQDNIRTKMNKQWTAVQVSRIVRRNSEHGT